MKLNALEMGSMLALAAIVAYSAGKVGACDATPADLAGEWEAALTLEHAYPAPPEGRTAHGRMRIAAAHGLPEHSISDAPHSVLRGDFRALGLGRGDMPVTRVRRVHGDSVQVVLGGGTGAVVLVGVPQCARITGRWYRESRAEAESGRFELRRLPAGEE